MRNGNPICAVRIDLDEFQRVFGDHAEWLYAKIHDFVKEPSFDDDFEYADNFRVANMANSEQMCDLEARCSCCGEGHWTFRYPDGTWYLLAWNYGH